jgi:hypothetical protein
MIDIKPRCNLALLAKGESAVVMVEKARKSYVGDNDERSVLK